MIPKELLRHYMRGLFDGDGCIGQYLGENGYFATLTTGSPDMLSSFLEACYENCNIVPWIDSCKQREGVYDIGFSAQPDVKCFLKWLYLDSTVSLDRKYNKALAVLG